MTLTQLQFVQAVAATKSFSKAAEECGVSQPSLSSGIAQLEEELGGRIFFRTSRKVGLTPFGEYFLPRLETALQSIAELHQAASTFRNPPHKLVRIGLSPLINIHLLTTVLEPFQQAYPEVEVVYKECCLEDSRLRLEADKIDAIIALREPRKSNQGSCLFYEESLYFLPRQTGLTTTALNPVKLSAITGETLIMTPPTCDLSCAVRQLFKTHRYALKEYLGQAMSHQVMEDWVSLGIGNAILPASKLTHTKPYAQLLLHDDEQSVQFVYELRWNKHAAQTSPLKEFIAHFRHTVPQLLRGLVTPQA